MVLTSAAWPFAVACMYVITDVGRVVNPPSGIGLIEIYYQATGSEFTTIVLLAAFAVCLFGCAVANITGSSRQIWAASRDNCYPMSTWLAEIHPKYQMPMNAACLTAIFTTVSYSECVKTLRLTVPALRINLPRINHCFRFHGQREHRFHDDLVCHSTGNRRLEGTF